MDWEFFYMHHKQYNSIQKKSICTDHWSSFVLMNLLLAVGKRDSIPIPLSLLMPSCIEITQFDFAARGIPRWPICHVGRNVIFVGPASRLQLSHLVWSIWYSTVYFEDLHKIMIGIKRLNKYLKTNSDRVMRRLALETLSRPLWYKLLFFQVLSKAWKCAVESPMANETWQKSYLIFNQHAGLASLVFESQINTGPGLKGFIDMSLRRCWSYVIYTHLRYVI